MPDALNNNARWEREGGGEEEEEEDATRRRRGIVLLLSLGWVSLVIGKKRLMTFPSIVQQRS